MRKLSPISSHAEFAWSGARTSGARHNHRCLVYERSVRNHAVTGGYRAYISHLEAVRVSEAFSLATRLHHDGVVVILCEFDEMKGVMLL